MLFNARIMSRYRYLLGIDRYLLSRTRYTFPSCIIYTQAVAPAIIHYTLLFPRVYYIFAGMGTNFVPASFGGTSGGDAPSAPSFQGGSYQDIATA